MRPVLGRDHPGVEVSRQIVLLLLLLLLLIHPIRHLPIAGGFATENPSQVEAHYDGAVGLGHQVDPTLARCAGTTGVHRRVAVRSWVGEPLDRPGLTTVKTRPHRAVLAACVGRLDIAKDENVSAGDRQPPRPATDWRAPVKVWGSARGAGGSHGGVWVGPGGQARWRRSANSASVAATAPL